MRSYKYRLYPSNKQSKRLISQLILCKELYNILLEKCKETFQSEGKTLTKTKLCAIIKEIKDNDPRFKVIHSQALQNISDRLVKAYANFFRRVKEKKSGKKIKVGFPRFKKFYRSMTYPQSGYTIQSDKRLKISKIGSVPMKLHRVPKGTIKTMTILCTQSQKWFVTFTCEMPHKNVEHPHKDSKIGIDVGLDSFATFSDGTKIECPKYFRKSERRLGILHRRLARKVKGSNNRKKARLKVARMYEHISNQRMDFIHKLSRMIADKYGFIAIEDLNISGMAQNHPLSKSIYDAGWSMLINQLPYKASSAGGVVQKVGRFYPSSQLCSGCGNQEEMPLDKRVFECTKCGKVEDRDTNSSKNIQNEGWRIYNTNTAGQQEFTPAEIRPILHPNMMEQVGSLK